MDWPFDDPPNVAVFTSKAVTHDGEWIAYVSHDEEDGAWQFHSKDGAPGSEEGARIVSLRSILASDPSVAELADLPLGWCASRQIATGEWIRRPKQ